MIRSLNITDPARVCLPWWSDVEMLQGQERIEFKPGLNILWGPNGSGKSTILKAMARMLHCEQGGTQTVTNDSFGAVFGSKYTKGRPDIEGYCDGALPEHDGQPVLYFDPGALVGLLGKGAAFDWDFGMAGLQNAMFKGSAGETTMMRANSAMMTIFRNQPVPEVTWKKRCPEEPDDQSDEHQVRSWEKHQTVEETLRGTLEDTGVATLLLDEPDRSLDIPVQARYWLQLGLVTTRHQVIAASHSVFAMDIPNAHYVEIQDDYLERSRQQLELYLKLRNRPEKK
jgi:predicted ATPase